GRPFDSCVFPCVFLGRPRGVPRLRPHAPEPAAGALRAGHGDRAGAAEPVRAGGRPEEAYPHRGGLVEVPRGGGRELPGLPAALGPGGPARRGLPARGREAAQRVPDARAGRLRGAAGGLRAHPAGAARGPAQHRRDLRLPGPGDGGAGRGPARAPADLRGRPVRAGGHDVPAALGHVPLRPAVQRARAAGLRRGLLGSPGGRGEAIRRPAAGQGSTFGATSDRPPQWRLLPRDTLLVFRVPWVFFGGSMVLRRRA
ncbi:unnamed protein product, partial [Prorocentrum cordatum]